MGWAMQEFGCMAVISCVGTLTYVPMVLYIKAQDEVSLVGSTAASKIVVAVSRLKSSCGLCVGQFDAGGPLQSMHYCIIDGSALSLRDSSPTA